MKRAALAELVKLAALPTYRETLRGAHAPWCNLDFIATVVADGLQVTWRVEQGTTKCVTVDSLRPDELRRIAEIVTALVAWEKGDGDWPAPRQVSP